MKVFKAFAVFILLIFAALFVLITLLLLGSQPLLAFLSTIILVFIALFYGERD